MGRQIQVALLDEDEADFVAFLRSSAQIQIIESFAPTPAHLFVDRLLPREDGHWQYFIWNKAFAWEPELSFVAPDAPNAGRRGWAYISNKGSAPLIEYDRHNFAPKGAAGRVYWAKAFSAPLGVAYDVASFEVWYNSVVRWLRKRGRRVAEEPNGMLYLPQALAHRAAAP